MSPNPITAAEIERLREAPEKLSFLADWIDAKYPNDSNPEVQEDLRAWARALPSLLQAVGERDRLQGIVQMYREGKIVPDDIQRLLERDRILSEIEKVVEEYRDEVCMSVRWRFLVSTYDEARRRAEEEG